MKKIDINPYSTPRARGLWQEGFEGKPLNSLDALDSFNGRAWQKGREAGQDRESYSDTQDRESYTTEEE